MASLRIPPPYLRTGGSFRLSANERVQRRWPFRGQRPLQRLVRYRISKIEE